MLRQRAKEAVEKQSVMEWLVRALPEELRAHASSAAVRGGVLLVTADSAAWSTRLRYVLVAMRSEIEQHWPEVKSCQVRVRPKRAATSG
jgi:hypothetical protein